MSWKEQLAAYFSFTRRDRIAVIVLALLITSMLFLPDFMAPVSQPVPVRDTAWISALKKIERKEADSRNGYQQRDDGNNTAFGYDRPVNHYRKSSKGELFYFDPNSLSAPGWKKLGIRDKTIGTIQNYLARGGKFKKPGDLQKIYGLFPDEWERIAPFIKIPAKEESEPSGKTNELILAEKQPPKKYAARFVVLDINTADTMALIALPGIGNKLANRIINFREKLGGFYSVAQVAETFGLPDSTYQKIRPYLKLENTAIRKININTATIDELKAHPYIRYNLANPIIAYRNQNGSFAKKEDIKKIMVITNEIYVKLAPYLSVQ